VSLLMGLLERASIQDGFAESPSPRLPRLLRDAFSLGALSKSSVLALAINPLNLLSPRALPNPDFFSD
jgi:hypothetical protein